MGAYQPSAAPRGPAHAQTMVYLSHDWSRMPDLNAWHKHGQTQANDCFCRMYSYIILDDPTPSSGEQNSTP